jgi:hypothetical protein
LKNPLSLELFNERFNSAVEGTSRPPTTFNYNSLVLLSGKGAIAGEGLEILSSI